ncbi:beta family protein [Pantoea sp. JGM49]|uniref:beta family protein n=1 Tax=unclassified Pantoea TaxID=2630326 RepID=UPI001BAAF139|nr:MULTISPECIES: beta family protein [unclassified Pantoea]MBS0882177.1 beta family protein [Pantoea sp. JGM49]
MDKFIYFPLLKTRDAELKAISNLDDRTFSHTLPIYELTKSRKTTVAPDGDIHRKMSSIRDVQKDRPFILDLTSNEKYINPQIEQLLDENDGFREWRYFIGLYSDLNIIPMIHIYDEDDLSDTEKFVNLVSQEKKYLALRVPHDLEDYKKFINPIVNQLSLGCKLIIIFDAEQVSSENMYDVSDSLIYACKNIEEYSHKIDTIVIVSTSFPLSPASIGNDDHGDVPIVEERIFHSVSREYPVKYGDYASINIEQVEIRGGTFVPRIDIALDDKFFYKRYRRDKGSYSLCAKKVLEDKRYVNLGSWADSEINKASNDEPSGISPSFWISVRMNYYMSTRVMLRNKF